MLFSLRRENLTAMQHSIVEYLSEHEGYRCGYCGSPDSNYSHGMWAHNLLCQDYLDLIDRGWRRSGKYVYKPTMDKMCCPQYTIRCHAPSLKMTKSQKKVLKRATKFFTSGERPRCGGGGVEPDGEDAGGGGQHHVPQRLPQMPMEDVEKLQDGGTIQGSEGQAEGVKGQSEGMDTSRHGVIAGEGAGVTEDGQKKVSTEKQKKIPRSGLGPDPTKPPCKKSKLRRLEKRQERLKQKTSPASSEVGPSIGSKAENSPKSLEEFIVDTIPGQEPKHRFEIKLVRSSRMSDEFTRTLDESFEVYKKYQMFVHKDPESKCNLRQIKLIRTNPPSPEYLETEKESHKVYEKYQTHVHNDPLDECALEEYKRFLVDSPLAEQYSDDGPECGYGSFHQHYILDGKIIAVGVMDILPTCVSSVYFYYDPEYRFLTLGTFSALRELAFIRLLHTAVPTLEYYYMGFYVHSCSKMRYKSQYYPSYLLCPEVYTFHPIDECKLKLDVNKYSRFALSDADDKRSKVFDKYPQYMSALSPIDIKADTPVDLDEVLVLHKHVAMTYQVYKQYRPHATDEEDSVKEYAEMAGKKCVGRMLLYRS